MPKPVSRRKAALKAKAPTFCFTTRRLRGVPVDTPAERDEAEKMKAKFIAENGVKRK